MQHGVNLRTEQLGSDISVTTVNTDYTLNTSGGLLPNERWYKGIWLEVAGRLAYSATGPTTALADGVYALIDRVQVQGFHRLRNRDEKFIDVRGADLREWCRVYGGFVPQTTGALTTGATASNDFRFFIYLPFTPLQVPKQHLCDYLLDAPNYDNLQLTIRFADDKSVFSGQTGTTASFTAYGSASGKPIIAVTAEYAMRSDKFKGLIPARPWLYQQEVTAGDIVNGGVTQSRLLSVPRGNFIRSILLKTGVKATGLSAGQNAYSTLSDDILTNIIFQRGTNTQIRKYRDFYVLQNEIMMAFKVQAKVAGYALLDFVRAGDLSEVFNATGLIAGPTGDVDTAILADVASGAVSNQAMLALFQEIKGQTANVGAGPSTVRR